MRVRHEGGQRPRTSRDHLYFESFIVWPKLNHPHEAVVYAAVADDVFRTSLANSEEILMTSLSFCVA
uniref:Uncharacterized protein n=1 Tax=Heterorhabditis bacteriophora TaxID=37862 RepID=A0A1I7WML9_HETBA